MDVPAVALALLPLHMGALHPMETLVMVLLALGPFVILALVVTVVSRRDRRAEGGQAARPAQTAQTARTAQSAQSFTPPEQPDAGER